jgi:hypothetical protein
MAGLSRYRHVIGQERRDRLCRFNARRIVQREVVAAWKSIDQRTPIQTLALVPRHGDIDRLV